MALTNVKIRNEKQADKLVKLFDSDVLFLLVTSQGGKYFRMKYCFDG